MSTNAQAIRTAIAVLTAQLAIAEGKPPTSYLPTFDTDAAERQRLEEIANRLKPHDWVDLAPGTGGQAGDNDKPDDDLLRAFGPFIDALTKATNPIQVDSNRERWTLQTIKKRAGFGPKSWGVVRDEIMRSWFTAWGVAWRNDPRNIAAGLVPKPEVVEALFSKDYE